MIKLADFGLGKQLETSSMYAQDLKEMGAVVYMAPEFFEADKPKYKKSVDIWSFGCIVFEILHFKRLKLKLFLKHKNTSKFTSRS